MKSKRTKTEQRALSLLKSLEILIRVNAPLGDGSTSHEAVLEMIEELEAV